MDSYTFGLMFAGWYIGEYLRQLAEFVSFCQDFDWKERSMSARFRFFAVIAACSPFAPFYTFYKFITLRFEFCECGQSERDVDEIIKYLSKS